MKKKKLPTFWYERRLWNRGYKVIVGLDEVGRGAWAGPLVVGAVVFLSGGDLRSIETQGIDDSKRLSAQKRERLSGFIKEESLGWAVAQVPVSVINRLGIGKATQVGFRRAVSLVRQRISERVDYVLVDAFYVSRMAGLPRGRRGRQGRKLGGRSLFAGKGRQLAIVKGDQKSISIAAASIMAKVYRDDLMHKLSKRYRKYGWERNVGYGTTKHRRAILENGLSRWHRKQFVETGLREYLQNRLTEL